jgi:hypothetical protein
MNQIRGASRALDSANANLQPYLKNPYILGIVTLVLILYGSMAQQTLPEFMYKLFDNRIFTMMIFAAIAFIGTQDFTVAFVVALIYGVVMHNLSQKKITEAFLSGLRSEGFIGYDGRPVRRY